MCVFYQQRVKIQSCRNNFCDYNKKNRFASGKVAFFNYLQTNFTVDWNINIFIDSLSFHSIVVLHAYMDFLYISKKEDNNKNKKNIRISFCAASNVTYWGVETKDCCSFCQFDSRKSPKILMEESGVCVYGYRGTNDAQGMIGTWKMANDDRKTQVDEHRDLS